jgi:hypothetical protein
MTKRLAAFIDELTDGTEAAARAEDEFRRTVAARLKALETERVFAFRRLNLMRAIAASMTEAENEEMALAAAAIELRGRLGWSSDSDARSEVLSRFSPVVKGIFALSVRDVTADQDVGPARKLAEFEQWYAATHAGPFWALFDSPMPETPLVDF